MELPIKKHGVEFFRNERGYFFRNRFAALIYVCETGAYTIQLRTPGIKASRFYKRVYFGTERPANRTLTHLSRLITGGTKTPPKPALRLGWKRINPYLRNTRPLPVGVAC